ncbi:MAG: hypothetical protein WCT77_14320, partial [Bacteroidota bacterium]
MRSSKKIIITTLVVFLSVEFFGEVPATAAENGFSPMTLPMFYSSFISQLTAMNSAWLLFFGMQLPQ